MALVWAAAEGARLNLLSAGSLWCRAAGPVSRSRRLVPGMPVGKEAALPPGMDGAEPGGSAGRLLAAGAGDVAASGTCSVILFRF